MLNNKVPEWVKEITKISWEKQSPQVLRRIQQQHRINSSSSLNINLHASFRFKFGKWLTQLSPAEIWWLLRTQTRKWRLLGWSHLLENRLYELCEKLIRSTFEFHELIVVADTQWVLSKQIWKLIVNKPTGRRQARYTVYKPLLSNRKKNSIDSKNPKAEWPHNSNFFIGNFCKSCQEAGKSTLLSSVTLLCCCSLGDKA